MWDCYEDLLTSHNISILISDPANPPNRGQIRDNANMLSSLGKVIRLRKFATL